MHQHFMRAGDFPKQVLGNFALTVHIRPRPPDALKRWFEHSRAMSEITAISCWSSAATATTG